MQRFVVFALAVVALAGCWQAPRAPTAVAGEDRAWRMPESWPHMPSLRAIHGTSLDDVYAVGDGGAVVRSTDRGATWQRLSAPEAFYFTGVWARGDGAYAIANVFEDRDVPRAAFVRLTSGGSESMLSSSTALEGVIVDAVWGSGDMLYVTGSWHAPADAPAQGFVGRTADAGRTWTLWKLGTSAIVGIGGTGAVIHALSRDGTAWTSSPNADNFVVAGALPPGEYEALDVAPGRLLAAAHHRGLYRSTDGGATWTEVRAGSDGHVWSLGDAVIALFNGFVARSADGGTTWTSTTTHELAGAMFGTRDGLIAVGQGGLIMTSADGERWERRDRGVVSRLADVWGSEDGRHVMFVGDDGGRGGVIARTTDGGATFALARGGWPRLRGVWGAGAELAIVVGDGGTILRSLDRGARWEPAASGTDTTLHAVGGCDARAIYAVGRGALLVSRDRGASWAALSTGEPAALLTDVACIAGVVYAGGPGDVLRIDAGAVRRVGPALTAAARERIGSRSTGEVWGRDGEVWWLTEDRLVRTRDGVAWTRVPTTDGPHYAACDGGGTSWITGWAGSITAIDPARRAHAQQTPASWGLAACWVARDGQVWAVGGHGTVVVLR